MGGLLPAISVSDLCFDCASDNSELMIVMQIHDDYILYAQQCKLYKMHYLFPQIILYANSTTRVIIENVERHHMVIN